MPTPRRIHRRRVAAAVASLLIGGAFLFANMPESGMWRQENTQVHASAPAQQPLVQPPSPFTVSPQWPANVAAAAVGLKGHGTLAVHGSEAPRPIASIAKTITALAILEKFPLQPGEQGPSIPITVADEALYDHYYANHGSVVAVKAGVPISQRQALEAMMLPSANNISDTAAIWAFGSIENYHVFVNGWLKRNGMQHTTVGGDASGYSPLTTSTPRDLVRLGELALENAVLADIVAMPITSNLPVGGPRRNYNKLVTNHGYSGIKLGDTDEAGITLLFAAPYTSGGKTHQFIGVVLGAKRGNQPQTQAYEFMESVKQSVQLVK